MNYKVFGFKIIQNLISHFWLLGVLFGISLLLFIFLFKEWWVEFKCGIQEERESTVTGGWGWTWVLLLCCWLVTWTLDTIVYWFSGLVWKSNSLCRIMLNDRTGTILNSDFFFFFWLLCLVCDFKQQFSVFKQHFTYFNALFHPHVFPKMFSNNNFQFLNTCTKWAAQFKETNTWLKSTGLYVGPDVMSCMVLAFYYFRLQILSFSVSLDFIFYLTFKHTLPFFLVLPFS